MMSEALLDRDYADHVGDIRAEALQWLLVATLGAFTLLVAAAVHAGTLGSWFAPLALAVTAPASWWLRGIRRLAASVYVAGLAIAVSVGSFAYGDAPTIVFLAVVVVAASLLLGPFAGVVAAAPTTALPLLAQHGTHAALTPEWATATALAAWACAIVLFAGSRPLDTALRSAWRGYVEGMELARQLRVRQEELGRLSKSLQETCVKLEEVNLELERARRAATEARRLKDEFAAAVSHEMRTPLNLIIAFTEMMVVEPERHYGERLPSTFRTDLEVVYRNACHLSNLIDDVLDLAQIEAHRMSLQKAPVSLARIVDEAVTSVSRLLEKRGLRLTVHVPPDLPPLGVDRSRIRQVLVNLLSNAARFTIQGGVTVTAVRQANECVVSVADTGSGIPPEDLTRVFEEFRQLGRTGAGRSGSGLGLTISKRLVELHGGSMWVESRLGLGSTFYFTLPLSGNVAAVPIREEWETWARVSPEDRRPTILVVDDEGDCTRVLRRYLDGYHVLGVASAVEASQAMRSAPVAAVVVNTPYGEATLDLEVPQVPRINCSVRGVRALRRELGVADYLVKPVSREQLRSAFKRAGIGPGRVLVVDDDPEVVRMLALMLDSVSGPHSVQTACDGAEALEVMRQWRPDLVLLDLMMPGVDGLTVLARMRGDPGLRDVPVVVVTAKGAAEERVVATEVRITHADGLSAAEFVRCLRGSLDALLDVEPGNDSMRRAAPLA